MPVIIEKVGASRLLGSGLHAAGEEREQCLN